MLNIIILACVQAKLLEQLPTRFNTCMSTWLYTLSYTIALFLFVLCNPKNLNHAAKTVLCRYFTLWWQIPLCGAVLASYSVEACAGSWSVRRGRCFFCQWLKHWSKCCTALYVSVQCLQKVVLVSTLTYPMYHGCPVQRWLTSHFYCDLDNLAKLSASFQFFWFWLPDCSFIFPSHSKATMLPDLSTSFDKYNVTRTIKTRPEVWK